MEADAVSSHKNSIIRLDRFIIPTSAYAEFLKQLKQIHALLREQPGLRYDLLFERPATDEAVHLMSMVEWADQNSLDAAKRVVDAYCHKIGFDRDEVLERLKIIADIGIYEVS